MSAEAVRASWAAAMGELVAAALLIEIENQTLRGLVTSMALGLDRDDMPAEERALLAEIVDPLEEP